MAVARVLDTRLKLVTIKRLKVNNYNVSKVKSEQRKTSKTIFRGAFFREAIFYGHFTRSNFPGALFCKSNRNFDRRFNVK